MTIGLGIESTAHTLGIGIVKDGKIIANEKDSYSTKQGGIIPMQAAKHHEKAFNNVLKRALSKAKIKLNDLNFISFSCGPGLSPCLLIGLKKAKELSSKSKKPLIPVNHCIAHLEIGKITKAKNPVMLYVSGANTQIIAYASGKYRIFGETLDIGVGNFIDNFARYAGIGFPGGPIIEQLAKESKTPPAYSKKSSSKISTKGNYIELPYKVKGMDIALSGILTNLKQKIEKIEEVSPSQKFKQSKVNYNINDLAYSMQETVFAMLVETAERALAHTGKNELLLGGGVACNSRLQEMCEIMCKERGCKLFVPDKSLLVDNGSMIAYLGEILYKNKNFIFPKNITNVDIYPRQRTDQVEITYK